MNHDLLEYENISHNVWSEQHFEWVENYALCFQASYITCIVFSSN